MIGIEVEVPAAKKNFDIYVPAKIRIHEMKQLICELLQSDVEEWISPDEETLLCWAENGTVLNENHSAEMAGIESGMKLLLL